jgi:hypothetical protein
VSYYKRKVEFSLGISFHQNRTANVKINDLTTLAFVFHTVHGLTFDLRPVQRHKSGPDVVHSLSGACQDLFSVRKTNITQSTSVAKHEIIGTDRFSERVQWSKQWPTIDNEQNLIYDVLGRLHVKTSQLSTTHS